MYSDWRFGLAGTILGFIVAGIIILATQLETVLPLWVLASLGALAGVLTIIAVATLGVWVFVAIVEWQERR